LLDSIGQHRSAHIIASKGKRSKKRKRKESAALDASSTLVSPAPPPPAIHQHVTIGLNSTTRHLESFLHQQISHKTSTKEVQAAENSVPEDERPETTVRSQEEDKVGPEETPKHLAAIFMTEAAINHLPYSHLPTLTALASASHPSSPKIRLVQLRSVAEAAICKALGLPRAGVIGILTDAPGAGPLLEYVREVVDAVDVPWTREVAAGRWMGTKILLGQEDLEG
jgi:ribonuclease P/MRP protein subunit POP3